MCRSTFLSFSLVLVLVCLTCATNAQETPPAAPVFATNTNGFLTFGPNGANNLVQFNVELPPIPEPGDQLPDPPFPTPVLDYTIVMDLSSDVDANGDGVDDTLGNFSGLEWASGIPGSGPLIGCVLNDDDGDGEFYRICLLYTSPSPRDQRGSRMPSSA